MADLRSVATSILDKKRTVFQEHMDSDNASEALLRTLLCEVDLLKHLFQEAEGDASDVTQQASALRGDIFHTLKERHGG